MAIWFADGSKHYDCQASLEADAGSDASDLPSFATEYKLRPGSECLIVASSDFYKMNSNGDWVKM